jgi:TetR/AcrR family tetracycline transcriptional repressor
MVARAALHVVDEVGLDALTMRRLAAHLDIQNPSLYWHFTNKQELLNCMAELMLADAFAELHALRQGQDWADWLAGFARLFRKMMFGHRDGARILAEADMSLTRFLEGLELALEVLQDAGFDATEAAVAVVTVIHFVLGHAFQAQADPLFQHAESDNSRHTPEFPIDGERFPRVAAFLHSIDVLSPATADAQFEEGLSLILDGLRAKLAKER